MKKTWVKLAVLLAFVVALGMGCCDACNKSVGEAKMYADQAAASAAKADMAVQNVVVASESAKASADKASAAADRAEAAAAKSESLLMKKMRK